MVTIPKIWNRPPKGGTYEVSVGVFHHEELAGWQIRLVDVDSKKIVCSLLIDVDDPKNHEFRDKSNYEVAKFARGMFKEAFGDVYIKDIPQLICPRCGVPLYRRYETYETEAWDTNTQSWVRLYSRGKKGTVVFCVNNGCGFSEVANLATIWS